MPRPSFRIGGLVLYEEEISRIFLNPPLPGHFDPGVRIVLKGSAGTVGASVIDLPGGREAEAFRFYWDNMAPQTGSFDVLRFYDNREQILKLLEKQRAEAAAAVKNRAVGVQQAQGGVPPLPKFRPVKQGGVTTMKPIKKTDDDGFDLGSMGV